MEPTHVLYVCLHFIPRMRWMRPHVCEHRFMLGPPQHMQFLELGWNQLRSSKIHQASLPQRKQAPIQLLHINRETTLPRHLLIPWWDKPNNLHATVSKQNRTVVVVKRAWSFSKRNHPTSPTNTELWSLVSKDVYVHFESLWKPTYLKITRKVWAGSNEEGSGNKPVFGEQLLC